MSIFDGLITSKMRVRILMRLFLNPDQKSYIRELADEMHASSSQVSEELKKLTATGLLQTEKTGRQINYQANQTHPLYPELHSMVKKSLGMDRILDSILERLGDLQAAYLLDDYAQGKDTGLVDLLLVGDIDRENLDDLVKKTEKYINRKIRTIVLNQDEYQGMHEVFKNKPRLLLWGADK
ncbi:MAG: winged helix-turn-helix transcriptional regulator [Gammaproteobacteria bacterium]|nr:winged helix-turn-helix transcriptional regulator [Gammaproteobacteria bacterium]